MHIQSVSNAPNFQANYFRTAKQVVKSGNNLRMQSIDIYSIDERYKGLIEKLLMKIDLCDD